jgi:mono/diheme cytochrome c family protein
MRLRLAGFVLLGVGSAMAMASSQSQREHGAQVYAANGCQHCHSIANVGGHKGPDLSSVGRTAKKDAIHKQIVYGSKIMPAFGEILSPAEVDDLVRYLRSCKAKPVPQVKATTQAPPAATAERNAQAGGSE